MQSHPPNFTTRFWWQDGQKWRRLHEKASRYSWPHASQRTHAFRSLFGVKSLAKQFRKTYIGHLEQLYGKGELDFYGKTTPENLAGLIATLKAKKWIVYAKAPFAGLSRSSTIWAATPIGWPSPTIAWCPSTMNR